MKNEKVIAAGVLPICTKTGRILLVRRGFNQPQPGTWATFGAGRVLVGKATSGTFDTAGATGGVESVTLTAAQSGVPAHSHTQRFSSGANNGVVGIAQTGSQSTAPGINSSYVTANNTAANASEAHTNLQPYVVVYMWERTA
jgi:microcystin-dependent protein